MSCHAEYNVIRKFLIERGFLGWIKKCRIDWGVSLDKYPKAPKNIRRLMSKVKLVVVRTLLTGELAESKPCRDCIMYMRYIGVRRVYYTNANGILIHQKISEIQSEHICSSRRKLR